MGDKIERYCLICMGIGSALIIATIFFCIGSVAGFALGGFLGFSGLLMDFLTFFFGICGFVLGLYWAVK